MNSTTENQNSVSDQENTAKEQSPVRVWVDGCFDLTHYGHFNMFRQAKAMGDHLVVGVHTDEEIVRQKCLPVCTTAERLAVVRACRWVDEVVEDAPYVTSMDIVDAHNCDFCVHGDDAAVSSSGQDAYEAAKLAKRYRECRRTPSVSTTELVGRMCLMQGASICAGRSDSNADDVVISTLWISQFMAGRQFPSPLPPGKDVRVVYVAGAFDLCHAGHVAFLEAAKAMGDYLVVGIHDDATVRDCHGPGNPLLSLNQRVLSVLGIRAVDDVIVGAPYVVTDRMIDGLAGSCPPIWRVVQGKWPIRLPKTDTDAVHSSVDESVRKVDPYRVARQRGILIEGVETPFSYLTTSVLVDRIVSRRVEFEERNSKKKRHEEQYNPNRQV